MAQKKKHRGVWSKSATMIVWTLLMQGLNQSRIVEVSHLPSFTVSKAIKRLLALKCIIRGHKIGRSWEYICLRQPPIVATYQTQPSSMVEKKDQSATIIKTRWHSPHHLSGFFRVISGEPHAELPTIKTWVASGIPYLKYYISGCFLTFILGTKKSSVRVDVPASEVQGITIEEQQAFVLNLMSATVLDWSAKTKVAVEPKPYSHSYEWVNLSYPISRLFIERADLRATPLNVATPEGPTTVGTDKSHMGLLEATRDGSSFAFKQAELLFEGKLAAKENVLEMGAGIIQQMEQLKKDMRELAEFVVKRKP